MELYVKVSLIYIISVFFLVFNRDLVACIDFTNVTASNTATDDVTK